MKHGHCALFAPGIDLDDNAVDATSIRWCDIHDRTIMKQAK